MSITNPVCHSLPPLLSVALPWCALTLVYLLSLALWIAIFPVAKSVRMNVEGVRAVASRNSILRLQCRSPEYPIRVAGEAHADGKIDHVSC